MKFLRFFLSIFIFIVFHTFLYSQHLSFIENKKQWENHILYKSTLHNGVLFFEKNSITCVFLDEKSIQDFKNEKTANKSGKLSSQKSSGNIPSVAYRMSFENANANPNIKASGRYSDYQNYYLGNNPSKWVSNVSKYQELYYESLYPDIDLKYYESEHHLKYEFIVHPQGNPNQISINYQGIENLFIKNGNLHIKTEINEITELKPIAYQIAESGDTLYVPCYYEVKKNKVRFVCKDYNPNLQLIIDPVIIFCTYTGSTADNWGYTATYDQEGCLYSGGNIFNIGYPTTIGAFQTNYAGNACDIAISKFNTTGTSLIYSTYLGGANTEVPHSLIVNDNNELYVLGTTSSFNFPTTSGAYCNTFKGGTFYVLTALQYSYGSDMIISKFNAQGTQLLASTYIGGQSNDGLNTSSALKINYADEVRGEILYDNQSNIYVVSSTSSTDFPTTGNSLQPTYGGGSQDGCIFKFNHNLSNLIWSSFLGGSSDDAAYSMVLDANEDVYICGGTTSANFPITADAYQTTYQTGYPDGFISQINASGETLLNSTYLGQANYDQVYQVKNDKVGNIYVFGQTYSPGTLWVKNADWYIANGGQFITKFKPNLNEIIWSTQFGSGNTGPDISPTALMVDLCFNVYISGWGSPKTNKFGGTIGLPITADAVQKTTDNNDYYFMSLKNDASELIYGTYFGGNLSNEHVDGGTSRFDKKGIIYQAVCAGCGGHDDFPTTPGVWSNTNNSSNCNLGAVKFDFNLPVCVADFTIPNTVCAPNLVEPVNLSQITSSSTTYDWNFGDGTTSTLRNPSHLYNQSGLYTVTLVINDILSCNQSDSISKNILILSNSKDSLSTQSICMGKSVQLGIPPSSNPNISYQWFPKSGLNNDSISNPMATPTKTTQYTLSISDGVCIDTIIQTVDVDYLVLNLPKDTAICYGDSLCLKFPELYTPVLTVIWSSSPLFTDTLNTDIHFNEYRFKPLFTKRLYAKVSSKSCTDTTSIMITVHKIPYDLDSTYPSCVGKPFQIYKTSPFDYQYFWESECASFSNQDSLNSYITVYDSCTISLKIISKEGCSTTSQTYLNPNKLKTNQNIQYPLCYQDCNGSITLTPNGGESPYTILWNHNEKTFSINNLCARQYSFIITDNNGCKLFDTIYLTQPDSLNIIQTANNTIYCNNICNGYIYTQAKGGTPPYQYLWINGQNTSELNQVCAGSYKLTVTDSNQCQTDKIFTVYDTSLFKVDYISDSAKCYGLCNGRIQITASNGILPYIYQWENITENQKIVENLCAGLYPVTVKEQSGCTQKHYIAIKEPAPMKFENWEITHPKCFQSTDGSINFTIQGAIGNYQITVNQNPVSNLPLQNLKAGNYKITILDTKGCSIDTNITLHQPDSLNLAIVYNCNPCDNICKAQAQSKVQGGTPPYQYLWSNSSQDKDLKNLCNGQYSLIVTDANSCFITKNFNIIDTFKTMSFNIWTSKDTILEYEPFTIYATFFENMTYQWAPAIFCNTPQQDSTIAYLPYPGYLSVKITDKEGCFYKDSLYVKVLKMNCDEEFVYVPNAFTPNNDGINDILYVRSVIAKDIHLSIYDRLGEKVFETYDIQSGWDGNFKGKPCLSDVYYYYIEATCLNQKSYQSKGNITLIR